MNASKEIKEQLRGLDASLKALMKCTLEETVSNSELLLKILEVSTDGYWDWHIGSGKDGKEDYEYLSPRLKRQLGYEDHELENKPSSWMNLMHEDDLNAALSLASEHFKSKGDIEFFLICRYTHKEGHEVKILCRGNVIEWNEDGSPKRMVGTHTDITNLY